MITLDKTQDFDRFMTNLKFEFISGEVLHTLGKCMSNSIHLDLYMDSKRYIEFRECCLGIIHRAKDYAFSETKPGVQKSELTQMADFLTFSSKATANKYLTRTPYIEDDYMFNILEYTFYAIAILDDTIYRRFKTAYTLWQHSVEFGIAGYSEKTKKFYPYYLTYFGNKIFIVDAIKGEVKGFERSGALRGSKIVGLLTGTLEEKRVALAATAEGVYVPLVEENLYGTIKEVQPTHLAQSDRKKSERERKREQGYQVEETPWLTTALDVIEGSAYNIRTHSLIALMVYGLEVMKYGIMDCNSIFTIDHINGYHKDNRIENLQLLTRKANDQKKYCESDYFFNYFDYWENQIRQAKIVQSNYNFRKTKLEPNAFAL